MSRQLLEISVPRTAKVFVLDDDGERVLWFKKRLPNAVFSPSCTQSKQALSQNRFDFLFFDYNVAGGTGGDVAPPFRAACYGLAMAWFNGSLKLRKSGEPQSPGRNDLLMAAYLPYCSRFVTRDWAQEKDLNQVAAEADSAPL